MFNGNNSFELGSLVFLQALRAYSAEKQAGSGIREEVMAEADFQPAARRRNGRFARRSSEALATSYRTSPAGAK